MGEPTSDSSLATDLLGVCPRCSGHRSPGHCMPDTVRSSRGQQQVPGRRRRLGPAASGALCAGRCSEGLPDLCSPSPCSLGFPWAVCRARAETPASQLKSRSASCLRGSAGAQTSLGVCFPPHTFCTGITRRVPVLLAEYLPQ